MLGKSRALCRRAGGRTAPPGPVSIQFFGSPSLGISKEGRAVAPSLREGAGFGPSVDRPCATHPPLLRFPHRRPGTRNRPGPYRVSTPATLAPGSRWPGAHRCRIGGAHPQHAPRRPQPTSSELVSAGRISSANAAKDSLGTRRQLGLVSVGLRASVLRRQRAGARKTILDPELQRPINREIYRVRLDVRIRSISLFWAISVRPGRRTIS